MDGIIIINKPIGCTSHDIVYKVKKIFNEKVGHTGTLDPLAEGVLPLLIGKGTLCSKYLMNHDKKYIATIKLGIKTDTADLEGKIIEKIEKVEDFEETKIKDILKSFVGIQEQLPPIYSAIRVNGKKLYEYARNNEKVEIKPRQINIYDINLLKYDKKQDEITFEVYCGKGTYIRSLCEDIAKRLGTIGCMIKLKRIEVGEFNIKDSISIEELENNKENKVFLESKIILIEDVFKKYNSIVLNEKQIKPLLNGIKVEVNLEKDGVYKLYNNSNNFFGIGIVNNKQLKRDIII